MDNHQLSDKNLQVFKNMINLSTYSSALSTNYILVQKLSMIMASFEC